MSKVLAATCSGGVVTADGVTVADVTILSEGVAASSGFLILDEGTAYYVSKTSPDLKTTLTSLKTALDKTVACLNDIFGAVQWSSSPPPAYPTDLAALQAAITELNTLKGNLK